MHYFIIASQYLENYGTRFKPKGGRIFCVQAPCVYSAVALVQRSLNTEQRDPRNAGCERIEFPLMPDMQVGSDQYEFANLAHAIESVPDYERDDVVLLPPFGAFDPSINS